MGMKAVVSVVVVAILLGLAIGTGAAVLRVRRAAPKPGPRVEVDAQTFKFGKLDVAKEGTHDFTFTNRGSAPLTLTHGASSCKCTVGDIASPVLAPGESTTVRVKWHSVVAGPFHQSVTINTSDPNQLEIVLTVKGEFTQPLQTVPNELNFNQIIGNEPFVREARIFCILPNHTLKIVGNDFTDPASAKFFQVETRPLAIEELPQQPGALERRSGQS